jgi:hypothetical protein
VKTVVSILALIGPVFGGCSCASRYWYNPAKTVNEAEQDCRRCYDQAVQRASEDFADEYDGRSAYMGESPDFSGRYDHMSGSEFGALREWTLWGTTYRENLLRGCMKSKGYRLVRKDELASWVRTRWLAAGKVAGK